ncbi:MAG: glycine oxidase ThiO [Pyrinomonadaceae bacterium]
MSESGADVIVVGGGVVGLALARALALRGLQITLVERGATGAEASWAAGGMLAPQAEADAADPFFQLACASRDAYPAFAARLFNETGVDIEHDRTGTLYLAFAETEAAEIKRRYDWQIGAGLPVEFLTGDEARALEPALSERVCTALRFPLDGQVENRRLLAALRRAAEVHGVRVLEHTEVAAVRVAGERACGVETTQGFIGTDAVVVACGAWSSLLPVEYAPAHEEHEPIMPRVEPVRGQMLCFAARPALVQHVVYGPRGYLVPRRDGRLLAGSTSEHAGFAKAVTAEGLHAITTHALEIAPAVGALPLVDSWAGLRPKAANDWPLLGASPEVPNLYFATGHYRNGILLAPRTADLLAELIITHNTPRALAPFTPVARHRPASASAEFKLEGTREPHVVSPEESDVRRPGRARRALPVS